ncbi:MAG: hypothetical protein JST00_09490 [Deltaproteobacteria bacterium]|nr:hypothetical protein [Deltaproteobacteria bacterium]
MRLLHFVSLAILTTVALYYWSLARRGLRAARRISRLQTRAVANLEEGLVEVDGVIRAIGRPIRGPSGGRAVYLDVDVEGFHHQGKHRQRIHQQRDERKVDAVVVDASGEVKVDLEHVEVVGAATILSGTRGRLPASTKPWTKDIAERATHITIAEIRVNHEAQVVVSGRAKVVDSKVERGEGGYRDGAPTEKKTFLIHGTKEEPLLVYEGSERRLLWQASWPVAVLFVAGFVALALAGVVLAVIVA